MRSSRSATDPLDPGHAGFAHRGLQDGATFIENSFSRGLVLRDRLRPIRRWGSMILADPQFLAVDRAALGQAWVGRARSRLPVYSRTIRTAAERIAAGPLADALIWEADGRPPT